MTTVVLAETACNACTCMVSFQASGTKDVKQKVYLFGKLKKYMNLPSIAFVQTLMYLALITFIQVLKCNPQSYTGSRSKQDWSSVSGKGHKEQMTSSVTAACWRQYHGHLTKPNSTASSWSCTSPPISPWLSAPEQREEHTVCYASALYG